MQSVPPSQLTMAILAGGRGARLGNVEKGLLKKGGRTLVERLISLPIPRAETLLVTNRSAPYEKVTGARLVHDVPGAEGPAAGLVAALLAAKTQWVLVVGCDQCELTEETLRPLLAGRPEARCFQVGGHVEPVPMICSQEVTQLWDQKLTEEPSVGLKGLLQLAPLEVLPGQAHALRSVNSEADLIELGVERPS